jgi:hypothetical protein
LLAGQPGANGTVEGVGVDAGQNAAAGGCQRRSTVAADPERGQDLAGRVCGPLADRGLGLGAGQHGAERDAEHADQWMRSAVPVAGSVIWAREPSRLRSCSCASAAGGASHRATAAMGDVEQAGTAVRRGHGLG